MKNYEQKKNTATSDKLITAVYASYVNFYILVQATFLLNPDTNVPNYTVSYPRRHLGL